MYIGVAVLDKYEHPALDWTSHTGLCPAEEACAMRLHWPENKSVLILTLMDILNEGDGQVFRAGSERSVCDLLV